MRCSDTKGPLGHEDLQDVTLLPRWTVSHSLHELAEADLLEKHVDCDDVRRRKYAVGRHGETTNTYEDGGCVR